MRSCDETKWVTFGHGGVDVRAIAAACDYDLEICPICRDELCVLCQDPYDCTHDIDQRHGWSEP